MAEPRHRYYWRLFATALAFTLFGLGGLVLRFLVIPVINLYSPEHSARHRRTRLTVHVSFRWFIALLKNLGLISYSIHGVERLNRPGQLVIANHPSLIDVIFLIGMIRNATCVVKHSLLRNPFMRQAVLSAGYLTNRGSETIVADCAAALARGDALIVFPEGSRSVPGQPLRFQRGAAHVALASKAGVTPVIITCTPPMLTKHAKWYEIPPAPGHFTLTVGAELNLNSAHIMTLPAAKAAREVTSGWQRYFAEELTHERA
jgi:1-acyl-sn-glycerol-3-phosphate acyltransferase